MNFARHIKRNHPLEVEVIQFFSKNVKSGERRHLIDLLRKKGNYLKNATECFKPVRNSYIQNRYALSCDICLGFYSAKLLYRYRKNSSVNQAKGSAQISGQNKLVENVCVDDRLKIEVFPHMRADKISLEAKKDVLICAFGARYLKTHRDKHFVSVTSRKMRELAKIIMEVKMAEPSIKNMFEALQPQFYDLFVDATKTVAKYNANTDVFEAPTFAMNIATSLEQCCEVAITLALKSKKVMQSVSSAEVEANLKTMIHLFVSNWKYDISSQAANNLNLK